jgi:hypothetical protein
VKAREAPAGLAAAARAWWAVFGGGAVELTKPMVISCPGLKGHGARSPAVI